MRKRQPKTPEEIAAERKKKVQLSVMVEKEPVDYLRARAEEVHVSLSDLVNEAIKDYVEAIQSEEPN